MAKGRIVEFIISELDLYIIDKVRELRGRKKPYMSQVELSQRMGFAEGYVGKVENFSSNAKYNIRKLHQLAKALDLNSYCDLLPNTILENDLLFVKMEVNRGKNETVNFDEKNNVIKNYILLEKRKLSDKEIIDYNNRRRKKI
jgi:transcriptional regulator with XRE-family HTH domain